MHLAWLGAPSQPIAVQAQHHRIARPVCVFLCLCLSLSHHHSSMRGWVLVTIAGSSHKHNTMVGLICVCVCVEGIAAAAACECVWGWCVLRGKCAWCEACAWARGAAGMRVVGGILGPAPARCASSARHWHKAQAPAQPKTSTHWLVGMLAALCLLVGTNQGP